MRNARLAAEVLSLDRLKRMQPDQAAAALRYRQAEGRSDCDALEAWLAADIKNVLAWAAVNAAWADFDGPFDTETLTTLRRDAP